MGQLLVEALPVVEKVLNFMCRRNHLKREEAQDFASFVKLRLVEREEAILRSFRHRSTLATFLSVVVGRLLIDYRRKCDVSSIPLDLVDRDPPAAPIRDSVSDAEDLAQADRVQAALRLAVDGLPEEDRRIVELHFTAGLPVSKVAVALGLEAKPLYRRVVRILGDLRARLEAAGIRRDVVRSLMGRPELGVGLLGQTGTENPKLDPSKEG